jgi:outer membrane protein
MSRHGFNVPIYDCGTAASQTRQAKELESQSRMVLEQVRNQSRTAVASAWVSNEGTEIAITAAESELRAAGVALAGVDVRRQGGNARRSTYSMRSRI